MGERNAFGSGRAVDRRRVIERLGWGGLGVLAALSVPALFRFLRPRPGRGSGGTFDAGSVSDYRSALVSTRWVSRHRCWIVRGDGRLFALEARCTHLGCTPRWLCFRLCNPSFFNPKRWRETSRFAET